MSIEIIVDKEKCNACGLCAEICPEGVFTFYTLDKRSIHKKPAGLSVYPTHEFRCIGCMLCQEKCPTKSIVVQVLPEGNT